MVYISNATETGSIYSKKELSDIYNTCKQNNLYLFVDGARLSSALTSKSNDMSPSDFASYCDIFYVGGTKSGLLSGEAIVFKDKNLAKDMRYHIKNKGAMLAKGFVLGIQFEEIFKDNLYFKLGEKQNNLASFISDNLIKDGVKMAYISTTNQVFPILSNELIKKLSQNYDFEIWEKNEKESVVRFVTSFMSTIDECQKLIDDIKK